MSPVQLPPAEPEQDAGLLQLVRRLSVEPAAWAGLGILAVVAWFLVIVATSIVI